MNRWMARMMLSVVAIVVALSFCVTSVLFLGVALYMFLLSVMLAPAPAALDSSRTARRPRPPHGSEVA